MRGSQFRVITEAEFKAEKRRNPKFEARRGRIDFVILNPHYVSSNRMHIVPGKRYRDLRESLQAESYTALDLAIEVVYFPSFDKKPHLGSMKRRVDSTIQDYRKLVALREFTYSDGVPFCREAAMMFFSNTSYKGELKRILSSTPVNTKASFFPITL